MGRRMALLLGITMWLSGCAQVSDFGTGLKYTLQGEYYLKQQQYPEGLATLEPAAKADPANPEVHYYCGRLLLANGDSGKALPYLQRATSLDPANTSYLFWLGIAYGEMGQEGKERESYRKVLQQDPDDTRALTYLGNNLLRAGKAREALKCYDQALALGDTDPQALFNRAICLRQLGRTADEKKALLSYLEFYPSGRSARLATDRLNFLGEQSYRNYRLGIRTLTLKRIEFLPGTDQLANTALPSLDLVGTTVARMPDTSLDIIVYRAKDRELAKSRAKSLERYLAERFPDLADTGRLRVSWFGVAEKRTVLGKRLKLEEAVQFFLVDTPDRKKTGGRM